MKVNNTLFLVFICLSFFSCTFNSPNETSLSQEEKAKSEADFKATLQKHLDSVTNKDLESMRSTMSPTGKMQLIVPRTEIIETVDGFMDYHTEWFQDTTITWSFETQILNMEIGRDIGIGITEIIYREPERNGEPYFNRMIVSYALEKTHGNWYIIKDHASSIEKSTDKK